MRLRKTSSCILLLAVAVCLWLDACGSSGANVVTVAVFPAGTTTNPLSLVVTQILNLSATVNGATNVNVNWTCTFTTQTVSGTTTTTSAASPCTAATGMLSNIQPTSVTFTAPATVPNPAPTITITATSQADTKKTATSVVVLDSGIRVTINPATASIPTGLNFQFTATLTTDTKPNDVTWLITQQALTSTTPLPSATSCSPGCGTISDTGLYTAPATVPSTATATIVATSKLDPSRFGTSALTIVTAGPVSFTGIVPNIAPQGGALQDVFLNATNVTSLTSFLFNGTALPSVQVTPIAPVGSTAVTGARIRLAAAQLATAGTFPIAISGATGGPFNIQIVPVRPSLVATTPDSLPQTSAPTGGSLKIDGGYFGAPSSPIVSAQFSGSTLPVTTPASRQLALTMPPLPTAGLFPVSVTNNSASPSTAITNIAVFPDYSGSNPAGPVQSGGAPLLLSLTGATPSSIAIDKVLDMAVVAEAGSNSVEYINMNGGVPTLVNGKVPVGSVPTSVAVDESLHLAAVVNYTDRNLSLLQIPAAGQTPSATPVATVDLSKLIPTTAPTTPPTPPPFPFSVGIDPFTHLAIIAFASTNVGFIADINPANSANTSECLIAGQAPPCVISSVTLNTGQFPQIAIEPRIHLAYVTPGGAGTVSVVDLTQHSSQAAIATASRTSNVVTVTTSVAHNLNPGNPGTVLISGLPAGKNGTIFNGSFSVTSVIDAFNFTYSQTAADDTTASISTAQGEMSFGTAFLTFSLSPTTQGVAINPQTRTAMLADPNASQLQVDFISTLDQTVSSMHLTQGSIGPNQTSAPEIGETDVAFQPFSNTAVLFNPQFNQVSLIDPARLQRFQILATGQTASGSVTIPSGTLNLTGALAVDPATNIALVVNSGSNNISLFSLGSIKPVHIDQVLLASGGVPGAILPQSTLTTNSTPSGGAPPSIRILGTGFQSAGAAQVRLDGTVLSATSVVSDREIDATIPASFLSAPRHFALDVLVGAVASNATDFTVVQSIDLTPACSGGATPQPGAVAIDEQRNIAVVSNTGCGSVSIIDLSAGAAAPLKNTISVGKTPEGIDVIPRLGFAVVANNGDGTASIVNIDAGTLIASPAVGTAPVGVAINQDTGAAIVANSGSNSVSQIDLSALSGGSTTPTVTTVGVDQEPLAVAIDSTRGIAVVTALQLNGSAPPTPLLDIVNINTATPSLSINKGSLGFIPQSPTGIVFDPVSTLFYGTSSSGNVIFTFNAGTGAISQATVGINPTSLAFNPQTGTILTVNSASNTVSVIDAQTLKTSATLGIGGSPLFAAAIHPRTNLAVITDQANNRVLILPLPN